MAEKNPYIWMRQVSSAAASGSDPRQHPVTSSGDLTRHVTGKPLREGEPEMAADNPTRPRPVPPRTPFADEHGLKPTAEANPNPNIQIVSTPDGTQVQPAPSGGTDKR